MEIREEGLIEQHLRNAELNPNVDVGKTMRLLGPKGVEDHIVVTSIGLMPPAELFELMLGLDLDGRVFQTADCPLVVGDRYHLGRMTFPTGERQNTVLTFVPGIWFLNRVQDRIVKDPERRTPLLDRNDRRILTRRELNALGW